MCRFPILVLSSLTIIANTILQKYRHLSLLALPTIFCSYLIYITFIDFIYGFENITYKIMNISNLIFSIGLTIVAFVKDRLTKVDYSKWMYFFGAIGIFMFTLKNLAGFNCELWQYQLANFILSLIYILIDLLIKRRPFSIIGVLGVVEYIMYLEFSNIKNNTILLTSVVLITGLTILYVGVIYNKNIEKLQKFFESKLPQKVKIYLPQNRV